MQFLPRIGTAFLQVSNSELFFVSERGDLKTYDIQKRQFTDTQELANIGRAGLLNKPSVLTEGGLIISHTVEGYIHKVRLFGEAKEIVRGVSFNM